MTFRQIPFLWLYQFKIPLIGCIFLRFWTILAERYLQPILFNFIHFHSLKKLKKDTHNSKLIYEFERAQDAMALKQHHITYFRHCKCIFNLYFLIIFLFIASWTRKLRQKSSDDYTQAHTQVQRCKSNWVKSRETLLDLEDLFT
jgi:hypothetical protein